MDEVSSYVRLNLPLPRRQGRAKDCSTSSSNPMMEGPWWRVRREARARERHRHGVIGGIEIPQRSAFIGARVPSAVLLTHHLGDTAAEAVVNGLWAHGVVCPSSPASPRCARS